MRNIHVVIGATSVVALAALLTTVSFALGDEHASRLREIQTLAKVHEQLSTLSVSRRIQMDTKRLGLDSIGVGNDASFDQVTQQLDQALVGTGLASNYIGALNLATSIKVLIDDNIELKITLKELAKATSDCALGTKIEAGVTGSQGLISNTDKSTRNTVTAAGLLIPVLFYNCDFPKTSSAGRTKPMKTSAIDTSSILSDGTVEDIPTTGPLNATQLDSLSVLADSSISAIEGLRSNSKQTDPNSTAASASKALGALLNYVPTLTAMKNAADDESTAGQDSLNSCRLLTRLEQADNGLSGLVKGESDGKKNTFAIVGLALPIFFNSCKK